MQALLAFQKNIQQPQKKPAIFGARTQVLCSSHMAFKTQLLSALLQLISAKRAEKMPYLVHFEQNFHHLQRFNKKYSTNNLTLRKKLRIEKNA